MRGCCLLAIAFIALCTGLAAEEVQELSFLTLKKMTIEEISSAYGGKPIVIRGFLHYSDDGSILLTASASLKSCCVGSVSLSSEQIFLPEAPRGGIPGQITTVIGTLKITSLPDKRRLDLIAI